jgi:hypothetical protein
MTIQRAPSIRGAIRLAMIRQDCPVAPDAASDLLDIYRDEVRREAAAAASACPVLQCPWQPSDEGDLEEHLYDAHSARELASALTEQRNQALGGWTDQ